MLPHEFHITCLDYETVVDWPYVIAPDFQPRPIDYETERDVSALTYEAMLVARRVAGEPVDFAVLNEQVAAVGDRVWIDDGRPIEVPDTGVSLLAVAYDERDLVGILATDGSARAWYAAMDPEPTE